MLHNANEFDIGVPEDASTLRTVQREGDCCNLDLILELLKEDFVVLVPGVNINQSDDLMWGVADKLNLANDLEIQAGFAAKMGHRHRIGKYYMSTNPLGDYQCLPPHCEGNSFNNIQLISFFCHENETDGGETILLNVDDSSRIWNSLREKVLRVKLGNQSLTRGEKIQLKMQYRVKFPEDSLRDDDQILNERKIDIFDLKLFDVLTNPKKTYSRILKRELYAYWSSIENIDSDSAREYGNLLSQLGLHKESPASPKKGVVDLATPWPRIWSSGLKYQQLFKCKITRRLSPGDFIIMNNQTWAHSVSNWTPNSDSRKVAVAVA